MKGSRCGAVALAVIAWGCSPKPLEEPPRVEYTEEREPCADYNPWRNAYFGDLHSHTGLSFDAWAYENRHTPEDAFAFARGATIALTPLDADGHGTRDVALSRPLDFAMVSDHAEFLGEIALCTEPGSPGFDHETCQVLRDAPEDAVVAFGLQTTNPEPERIVDCPADPGCVDEAARERWLAIQDAAEAGYDRSASCEFVTFVGYEYTTTPQVSNMHRVVIFRNASVPPMPVTYYEARTPHELWSALADSCMDAGTGCDVMTIAHNMNLSNGKMYAPDYGSASTPEEEAIQASLRARIEPLVEIFQQKGDMECRNGFASVNGDPDPLCDFEKQWPVDAVDCGDDTGTGGMRLWGCVSRYDFVRNIFKLGMLEEERIGVNPYRLGVIAATDTHNAIPGKTDEDDYLGHVGTVDDAPEERLSTGTITHDRLINNPGGLAAVWAEERSRDAIFEAFRRQETFATSGPRIQVRLFGGWRYPDDMCADPDWVEESYRRGVPMGGDLPARPGGADAPRLLVWAMADPGTATSPGVPLQRIQIVKGWIAPDGQAYERVFDVAGDPLNGATVDPDSCETRGTGEEILCTVWADPEFDPAERAYYYARVLENPTCRWSAWECLRLDPADRPAICDDAGLPRVIQERAWTTPVWYSPAP